VPHRIDRRQPVLPWKAPENGRRVSPLEASTYYLNNLSRRELADRQGRAANRLEQQTSS